jgi:hypothetical protein
MAKNSQNNINEMYDKNRKKTRSSRGFIHN